MFTRFNGNVVPFADDATSTNRTVFGGTTQSDLIDDNLNTNFKKGWEIVGLNDNPTREDFNGMGYTLGALTAYLYEMGISEWNASQKYRANSRVTGSDGNIYKSLTGTTGIPNVGNNPTTDAVNWAAEGRTDYSALTAKTTPVDADLIAIADSTSSFSLKKLTWANIEATLKTYFDNLYLALTGDQAVDGVKTFTSSPIVPAPTTAFQVSTKGYVDSIISNIQALPIGAILNGYTIFGNCVVAFGGEFNRADYPKLWAYLQANPSLVKTQAQWQTEATANGGICGFFSDGNGTTTFRVPNLDKAFLRPDNRAVASYQSDAIRNITGTFSSKMLRNDAAGLQSAIGAFDQTTSSYGTGTGGSAGGTWAPLTFDASRVVPTSTENRPKNIAVLPLIVAK